MEAKRDSDLEKDLLEWVSAVLNHGVEEEEKKITLVYNEEEGEDFSDPLHN
eukprot:Pgem_evm1s4086